jgi:hypothetical protein
MIKACWCCYILGFTPILFDEDIHLLCLRQMVRPEGAGAAAKDC